MNCALVILKLLKEVYNMVMKEINADAEYVARQELLKKIGKRVEAGVVSNQLIYLSAEDARVFRNNVEANWEVFQKGCIWTIEDGEEVEVKPEDAMTRKVMNARSLLVLGALGDDLMIEVLVSGLLEALNSKGGGVWKGDKKTMNVEDVEKYARDFLNKRCFLKNFSFGKDDGEEQKVVLNRLEAMVNGVFYVLATTALEGEDNMSFELVQTDLLLSANFRLPILKGEDRSREDEDRNKVIGFGKASPINHLPPKCLTALMSAMARK